MAGKQKPPTLRRKGRSFVTDVYRADGRRTTVSFGPPDGRTEGEIYIAFGQWLDLFNRHPHKTLSFRDPYEAIDQAVSPTTIRTVGRFVKKYVEAIEQHSPTLRDGGPNSTLGRINQFRPFLDPYADWPVADFGPDELREVQDALVKYRYFRNDNMDEPIAYRRTAINRVMNEIYRMWQWGIGREITTEAQKQLLKEVRSLRLGQTSAQDRSKRAAVTLEEFNKVTENLSSVVADIFRIMWTTAMRPSEVCRMRPIDISRNDPDCWIYVPGSDASDVGDHKTAHLHRVRAIPLTSEVQAVLKSRIKSFRSKEYIFSPSEAIQELRDKRLADRKTPAGYGNRRGTNRQEHPMIKPGEQYKSQTLNVALKRACKRAGVDRFTPYDLRRSAATRIRSQLGKEAAKLILGHVSTDTTEIYLLDEVKESMKVAKQLDGAQEAEEKKPKESKRRKLKRSKKKS
ncbi:MAG: site-specific integrase [Planctomycetes bacterium]|nr:site-specific integrase [Planctomycetota bacterium]